MRGVSPLNKMKQAPEHAAFAVETESQDKRGADPDCPESHQSMGPLHHRGGREWWEGGKGLRLQWGRDSELGLSCLSHRKGGSLKGTDVHLIEYSVNVHPQETASSD